jgi:hypothetical protein
VTITTREAGATAAPEALPARRGAFERVSR